MIMNNFIRSLYVDVYFTPEMSVVRLLQSKMDLLEIYKQVSMRNRDNIIDRYDEYITFLKKYKVK